MGYIDAKGRPELVVHPDIISGRAVYRSVEQKPVSPAPENPRQRARRELIEKMTAERRAQKKAEGTTT